MRYVLAVIAVLIAAPAGAGMDVHQSTLGWGGNPCSTWTDNRRIEQREELPPHQWGIVEWRVSNATSWIKGYISALTPPRVFHQSSLKQIDDFCRRNPSEPLLRAVRMTFPH